MTGATNLKRALKVLGETDAPFLRQALDDSGRILEHEAVARAPGGIARGVGFAGVKGVGGQLRAVVRIKHPGARSMEFGRVWYYHGYRGRAQKSGQKFRASPGQKARPYLGVKDGGQAIAASKSRVVALLNDAFEREWERLGSGGN